MFEDGDKPQQLVNQLGSCGSSLKAVVSESTHVTRR